MITDKNVLRDVVVREVNNVQITDIHTHIYPGHFGDLLLWGAGRAAHLPLPDRRILPLQQHELRRLFALSKREQADLIWQTLFWITRLSVKRRRCADRT